MPIADPVVSVDPVDSGTTTSGGTTSSGGTTTSGGTTSSGGTTTTPTVTPITSYITTTGGVTPTTTNPLTGFSGNGFIYYVYNYNPSLATQTFQLNSTYKEPLQIYYFMVSGGGGGGYYTFVDSKKSGGSYGTYILGGGGGGAGTYDQGTSVLDPGEIFNITVGAGGAINTDGGSSLIISTDISNTDNVTVLGGKKGEPFSVVKTISSTDLKDVFNYGNGGNSSNGNTGTTGSPRVSNTYYGSSSFSTQIKDGKYFLSPYFNGNGAGDSNITDSNGNNRGSYYGEGSYTYFRGDNSKLSSTICEGGIGSNTPAIINSKSSLGSGGDAGQSGNNGIVILYFQDPAFVDEEIDDTLNTNIQIFNGTSGGGSGGAASNFDNDILYTSQSKVINFSDNTSSSFGEGGEGGHYLAQSTNYSPSQDTRYLSLGNGGSGGHVGSALESINGGDGSPGGVIIYFPLDDLTNTNVNIGTSLTVNNNLYLNGGIYYNLTTTGTLTIPNSKFYYYPGNTIYYTTAATTYTLPSNLPHCYNVDMSGSAATTIVLPNATANNMGQIITIYNWTAMYTSNKVNTQGSDKLYGTNITSASGVTTITYGTGFSSRIFQCGGLNKWFVITRSA